MTIRHTQRGATMLVVMVLLSVMLLGGLALARITEVGSIAVGNAGFREASLQASEIGLNTAFGQVRAITADAEDTDAGNWYWSTERPVDAQGLPTVDWNLAPEITVGAYSVRYIAERVCTVAVLTDPLKECLVKQEDVITSARIPDEKLEPPNARQFRVTVRVVGPKETTVFIQSLVTKG